MHDQKGGFKQALGNIFSFFQLIIYTFRVFMYDAAPGVGKGVFKLVTREKYLSFF